LCWSSVSSNSSNRDCSRMFLGCRGPGVIGQTCSSGILCRLLHLSVSKQIVLFLTHQHQSRKLLLCIRISTIVFLHPGQAHYQRFPQVQQSPIKATCSSLEFSVVLKNSWFFCVLFLIVYSVAATQYESLNAASRSWIKANRSASPNAPVSQTYWKIWPQDAPLMRWNMYYIFKCRLR
jgi:hypothetical protein